jgi:L-proline amide hydrolase
MAGRKSGLTATGVKEGFADFAGHRTWYRVTGDLAAAKLPVVCLHGGPGAAHNYLDSYKGLAARGRAVIHYDQLGCGKSTHLPGKAADFWTVALFVDELNNLLRHLGIAKAHHILGQSWGGMLGMEYAVTQPPGLRSLVVANSPPSMKLWVEEANRLRAALPPEVQATLLRHEAAGTTSTPEYAAAVRVFYDRHLCRVPQPPEVVASFAQIEADPTVYHTMNGPSEFHVVGSLKNWSIIDRLGRIAVPALTISGRHDEATPKVVQPIVDGIRNIRWEIFENSSHLPHVEETERCLAVVGDFLDQHDR